MPTETEWELGREDRQSNWAFRAALCLLGPLFFLSYLLSLLSPLPLLYLYAGGHNRAQGRAWGALASVVGIILSVAIRGPLAALGFSLFALVPAFLTGELLLRKKSLEVAVGAALLTMISFSVALFFLVKAQNPQSLDQAKEWMNSQVKYVTSNLLSKDSEEIPDATREELSLIAKDPSLIYAELPGIAFSALLLLSLLPVLCLIRWNPKVFLKRTGLPRDFLRKWKSPEWLVWPALLCGAFHIFEMGICTDVARNAIKPILLIYFFHGMSILAYFLDSLRLRGPIRFFLYGMGTLFLTPMVVSFGFFDLWFNFRSRNRPSAAEDKDL